MNSRLESISAPVSTQLYGRLDSSITCGYILVFRLSTSLQEGKDTNFLWKGKACHWFRVVCVQAEFKSFKKWITEKDTLCEPCAVWG